MNKKKTTRNKKQTRLSWIIIAFKTLMSEGIEQVRVERLAKKLGVTKGSFYWHFKDRTELLDGLLEYWASEMTQTVLEHAQKFHGDPIQRIYSTIDEIIGKERARYDPQVRAWASQDSQAKQAIDQIDKIRLSFLVGLFIDAGFDEEDSEIRARLIYYYILGEHFVTNKEPLRIRLEKVRKKVDLLIQPIPVPGRSTGLIE